MSLNTPNKQLALFRALFKGREDVFAVRWEKDNKSGYMPAYFYDRYRYRAHKMKGGTFQNFTEKKYLPFSDIELEKHLSGAQHAGIFPLLQDNTSWFIVADFDKANWLDESKRFLSVCTAEGLSAYIERSQSGNGGHVWVFFDQPYPAFRSRKIFIHILEEAGIFSAFDKESSFDRLFPNQDFLSGKGLGNLIALPLFKKSLDKGNSCFIDPETEKPYGDQWDLLGKIKQTTTMKLNELYQLLSGNRGNQPVPPIVGKLTIRLSNHLSISRAGLTPSIISFLKEELNFASNEFIIKKKTGRSTFGTERYFKLIEELEDEVIVPRGFTGKFIRFCKENQILYDFNDERKKQRAVLFSFHTTIREYQQPAIDATGKKDFGIIVAPPGSGKTIIGLKIIADKRQPALIITHRKQIAEQWMERIQAFLGIPKHEIGKIGHGKIHEGKSITVAMIQSLAKEIERPDSKIGDSFGIVIIDECHHVPADTFRKVIGKLNSYYSYGLTATPFRKYNDGKLMFIQLGEVISEIKPDGETSSGSARIIVRNTNLDIPFNPKTDHFETLSKILVHDSARNKLILSDVIHELKSNQKVVIITERKDHIETIHQFLKQSYETVTLSGEDSERDRSSKWKLLKEGNYQVLITTGQFFGEGSDIQDINRLFLVYPFSFEGKLIQYIGRVQRSELTPTIYDYRDIKIDYLNKMFLKRNTYYRKIDKQATLFDEPIEEVIPAVKSVQLDQDIKVPFEKLEFRYGSIAFKHYVDEIKREIEFDVENMEIRPEFEVLIPYFSKALNTKHIRVKILAEFENDSLISYLATSQDIERINREIIDGVKFKFVSKRFLGKTNIESASGLQDVNELQAEAGGGQLYQSGEEMLEDILKRKEYKHRKQLQYFASKHERTILKIRFVLSPFSFVFLLAGQDQFHLIMETLDTEEATYIWHFEKDKRKLPANLKLVDQHLNLIRNNGRQAFLQTIPENFSRILHDYNDEKKGFILWRDSLEERLS